MALALLGVTVGITGCSGNNNMSRQDLQTLKNGPTRPTAAQLAGAMKGSAPAKNTSSRGNLPAPNPNAAK